ncbi:cysteine rich repeat-containing protein [Microbaculum marinisediminis]|uniref:Cysteine rich repeat-containing protein n=1 Tax=Microbaculum marinisediminis TaxID=2931392 RepID=A0AAW5R590_9HYPH|nr:cysteine rich repeat-containing protein [Microbaculum sp. A6E488]MCT8974545.1 cysteine rich repeat-containing protein [Microbaculum sp. A6E488]
MTSHNQSALTNSATAFAVFFLVAGMLAIAPARAQTISYAQSVDELAKACGADIGKFCKNTNIGSGMGACMEKNLSKVSEQCKATFVATQASLAKRAAAQAATEQLCANDIKRFCKEYDPGNGRYLRCLLKTGSRVSAPCTQALTDAGWR